ncbi:unnamed protein product, partial [Pelagomonas calceolata]
YNAVLRRDVHSVRRRLHIVGPPGRLGLPQARGLGREGHLEDQHADHDHHLEVARHVARVGLRRQLHAQERQDASVDDSHDRVRELDRPAVARRAHDAQQEPAPDHPEEGPRHAGRHVRHAPRIRAHADQNGDERHHREERGGHVRALGAVAPIPVAELRGEAQVRRAVHQDARDHEAAHGILGRPVEHEHRHRRVLPIKLPAARILPLEGRLRLVRAAADAGSRPDAAAAQHGGEPQESDDYHGLLVPGPPGGLVRFLHVVGLLRHSQTTELPGAAAQVSGCPAPGSTWTEGALGLAVGCPNSS